MMYINFMKKEKTNMQYGDYVRKIILEKGDRFSEAAAKLGMSTTAMNYILTGRNRLSLGNLVKFCQIYDASLDEMYFNDIDKTHSLNKSSLIDVFTALEKWLKKKNYVMEPADKVNLAFALYDAVVDIPAEKREAEIYTLSEFMYKLRKTS